MLKLAPTKRPGSREPAAAESMRVRAAASVAGAAGAAEAFGGGGAIPGMGIGADSGMLGNLYLCGERAFSWQDDRPVSGIAGRPETPKRSAVRSNSVLLSVVYEGFTGLARNLIRGRVPGSLQFFERLEILEVRAITRVPGAYRRGYKAEFYHRRDGQQHRTNHAFPTLYLEC